jgi:hypothetical protein
VNSYPERPVVTWSPRGFAEGSTSEVLGVHYRKIQHNGLFTCTCSDAEQLNLEVSLTGARMRPADLHLLRCGATQLGGELDRCKDAACRPAPNTMRLLSLAAGGALEARPCTLRATSGGAQRSRTVPSGQILAQLRRRWIPHFRSSQARLPSPNGWSGTGSNCRPSAFQGDVRSCSPALTERKFSRTLVRVDQTWPKQSGMS